MGIVIVKKRSSRRAGYFSRVKDNFVDLLEKCNTSLINIYLSIQPIKLYTFI